MNNVIELTSEQDLYLRNFEDLVQGMSSEQARKLLVEQQKLMMFRQKRSQELLDSLWSRVLDSEAI
ncbi:hypothetical protein TUMEXPCC7403_25135 [Tumidithrix helvetica PCC 7403]|uniref:hypothetical protein n=1 Tax=Tumidithrix helvetica TaxID=3457545 RepID=UPI003CACBD03